MTQHKETTPIKLGTKTYDVPAFDIDQLEVLVPHFLNTSQPLSDGGFTACCAVVRVGLELHGLIKPGELKGLKTKIQEVRDAATEMGRISGLYVEVEPGEYRPQGPGTD